MQLPASQQAIDAGILLRGESGAGKELISHESELFGHQKGTFTSGLVERAHKGNKEKNHSELNNILCSE